MIPLRLLSAVALTVAFSVSGATHTLHTFKKLQLDDNYWSEGANFGDLNHDGKPDAISGPFWWEGPDFIIRHEIYPALTTFVVQEEDGTEARIPGYEGGKGKKNTYSNDNFFTFVYDFNKDGWNDVLTYGLPGTPAYLYLNPKGKDQHWARYTVFDAVDNESPTFTDITGDGLPEIICNSNGTFGYASPNWNDVAAKWPFTAISTKGPWSNFNHGLGVGDVNDDGRLDILEKGGWWEQPADAKPGQPWTRHPAEFSPGGGAQMYVYDVNGDGREDVITSMAAHGYGLGWFEQLAEKNADGNPLFKNHVFMNKEPSENRYGIVFSELHAVELVDIDGDGLKDIITGKCFWAHGPAGDPNPGGPVVLYWFKLVRHADGGVDWVPYLIDGDSGIGRQIGVADVNGDGRPEIIIGNKKGTFVFMHEVREVSDAEWAKAQPPVKFPNFEDQQLEAKDVIQRSAGHR